MAKTLFQKQEEALARMRAHFPRKSVDWQQSQPGGVNYEQELFNYGKIAAGRIASNAEIAFKKYIAEAKLDRHGNIVHG